MVEGGTDPKPLGFLCLNFNIMTRILIASIWLFFAIALLVVDINLPETDLTVPFWGCFIISQIYYSQEID